MHVYEIDIKRMANVSHEGLVCIYTLVPSSLKYSNSRKAERAGNKANYMYLGFSSLPKINQQLTHTILQCMEATDQITWLSSSAVMPYVEEIGYCSAVTAL